MLPTQPGWDDVTWTAVCGTTKRARQLPTPPYTATKLSILESHGLGRKLNNGQEWRDRPYTTRRARSPALTAHSRNCNPPTETPPLKKNSKIPKTPQDPPFPQNHPKITQDLPTVPPRCPQESSPKRHPAPPPENPPGADKLQKPVKIAPAQTPSPMIPGSLREVLNEAHTRSFRD